MMPRSANSQSERSQVWVSKCLSSDSVDFFLDLDQIINSTFDWLICIWGLVRCQEQRAGQDDSGCESGKDQHCHLLDTQRRAWHDTFTTCASICADYTQDMTKNNRCETVNENCGIRNTEDPTSTTAYSCLWWILSRFHPLTNSWRTPVRSPTCPCNAVIIFILIP